MTRPIPSSASLLASCPDRLICTLITWTGAITVALILSEPILRLGEGLAMVGRVGMLIVRGP